MSTDDAIEEVESAYVKLDPDELWWCNSHQRQATHTLRGNPCCDPWAGGIMLPCHCVELTAIAKLEVVS